MADPALLALAGVLIGTASTLLVTSLTLNSNERIAKQARLASRSDRARELIAEGYANAVDALQWLTPMHVEDSVDPQFAEEYVPRTEEAIAKLRTARESVLKVAALGATSRLSGLAHEVAVAMNTVDDAWHGCQAARRSIVAGAGSESWKEFQHRHFDQDYSRLEAARKALTGFDGSRLPRDEIDAGTVLPESLLHRLRELPEE